jgi:hypothetical protein
LYTFFTGKPATVKSSLTSRNTQFDLWKFDKEWAGKPVYISASMDSISTKNDVNGIIVDGADVSAYQYESAINFSFDTILTTAKNGTELELNTIITNTSNLPISLFEKQQPLHIVAIFVNKKDLYTIHTEANLDINNFAANSKQKHRLRFILKDILPAKYKFALGLMSFAGPKPSSEFYPFTIQ